MVISHRRSAVSVHDGPSDTEKCAKRNSYFRDYDGENLPVIARAGALPTESGGITAAQRLRWAFTAALMVEPCRRVHERPHQPLAMHPDPRGDSQAQGHRCQIWFSLPMAVHSGHEAWPFLYTHRGGRFQAEESVAGDARRCNRFPKKRRQIWCVEIDPGARNCPRSRGHATRSAVCLKGTKLTVRAHWQVTEEGCVLALWSRPAGPVRESGWARWEASKWAGIEKIRPARKEILLLFFLVFYFPFPNQLKCSFKLQIYLECTFQKLQNEYKLFYFFIYYTI
jgi:hypothetical protein